MKIILNGTALQLDARVLSYGDIVKLAGTTGHPTVMYSAPRRGDLERSGSMHHASPPLELEDGMVISAIHTDKA